MQGRLNIFQKTMLQWNTFHPYSAVHVARIQGALDAVRLRASINSTVSRRGLARLTLDCDQFNFQYEGGPANCDIQSLANGTCSFHSVAPEMERQLNVRFDHTQSFCPFRFFVAGAEGSFLLGVVYFHPAADAESVVCLLKDIVAAYTGNGAWGFDDSLDRYPESRARLLRRHPMVLVRKLLSMPAQIRTLRQSHRPRYTDPGNMTNGFACLSVSPEDTRVLIAAAKSWRVTVNDLLIAILMKSLSPCAAAREKARKRHSLSVGCIVNLRRDLGVDSGRSFGLFLGSFSITHRVPAGIGLRELAMDVQKQTLPVKQRKLYLGTPLELGFSRFMLNFFSPERRKKLYAKHYPLWGGITNMNVNSLWDARGGNELVDYFRGVSTGPITPLALSVTTVGDRMNLGLSYRTSVFSKVDIENLVCRFRQHIQETGSKT